MEQPSIVELPGRIDNLTSAGLETSIGRELDATPPALVLDFGHVTFVSSMGLRMLLMVAKRCRKQQTPLALHSVSKPVVDVFRVSGVTEFFPIHPTRETALAAVV
ncbi:MAG TPA: STAS domain-containing protein [Candidatus Acidoferrales bacterium]|jgi:anti-anti-sigma factor|nr:STAS domain-containing protein [Candidatus Acidoferrales bacterium]